MPNQVIKGNMPHSASMTLVEMPDGTFAERVVAINADGSAIGAGGGGGAGTPVVDNAGVRWLWIYDKEASTSIYISFVTGAAGAPTFPITPDADTSVQVSNFPATQPVSAASLPLPAGAATSALQTTGNTSLANIDADLGATADAAATTDTGTFSLIALVKRGLQNWTTLLARVPALVNNRLPVNSSIPTSSSGVILGLTTNATGTTYTAFDSLPCVALDIVNNTGVTIEYRRGATGAAMQIRDGAARMVIGITNANQVDVRRTDTANTTVTLQAEAFTA